MTGRVRAWNRGLDRPIDPRAIAVLRMAVGPLVIAHLQPFFAEPTTPHYTLPYASWYPTLPPGGQRALLWMTAAAAIITSVGLVTRLAAWATALGVGYTLFESQTYFHHNRAFLLILLVGVAVLPTGDRLSVDRLIGTPRRLASGRGRRLALVVLRIEVALVYMASGVSKLVDPDWRGGTVTLIRIERHVVDLAARLPGWAVDLLTSATFHRWAAPAIILTELFIGLGLLWRPTRLGAMWVAIGFHVAIEATASVQVFSAAGIVALVVWVTPTAHDRLLRLGSDSPATTARLIRALDWTGRFVVERHVGQGWEVVDRDGTTLRERDAMLVTLSRLPVTFPFAWPALLLSGRRAYPARVGAKDSNMKGTA